MTVDMGTFSGERLAGFPICVTQPSQIVQDLIMYLRSSPEQGLAVHLVNAHTIHLGTTQEAYGSLLEQSKCNLPDGRPLSLALRTLRPEARQIRGPQLFRDLLSTGREHGLRHFLLGSSPEVLAKLKREINEMYPGVVICGSFSPPYRQLTSPEVIEQDELIRSSRPDVVWVGLGTPKQDLEVERLAGQIPGLHIAVGAAFDFTAGTTAEAPVWVSRLGFEWLSRMISEPRRLWRRYLIGNPVFMLSLAAPRFARAAFRKGK